jgi:hypothetical protein
MDVLYMTAPEKAGCVSRRFRMIGIGRRWFAGDRGAGKIHQHPFVSSRKILATSDNACWRRTFKKQEAARND